MKIYYAVEYSRDETATTGDPNRRTGKLSIACTPVAFYSKQIRKKWVAAAKSGNCRQAVTRKELRQLCLGMSIAAFNESTLYMSLIEK